MFTELILNALRGSAADIKGDITPGSVYAYIDQALGSWYPRPVFKTNVDSFISLRTVQPGVPKEILRKLTNYFPEPKKEFDLNPSFEFTNSPEVNHEVAEPYAAAVNVAAFKDLQKYEGVGLVIPVGEEHMYFAAMKSKSCKLTSLGYHFWKLVKENKI